MALWLICCFRIYRAGALLLSHAPLEVFTAGNAAMLAGQAKAAGG
ncbi:hypothetical protein ACLH04_15480 [Enterobacter hormaechei]|nr:hypothetical protein [Enterobacter hormaechei]